MTADHDVPDDGPAPLTPLERKAINLTGELWGMLSGIVDQGPSRRHDLAELMGHVHAIQHAVMAQAAARCYPEEFRLLGGELPRRS